MTKQLVFVSVLFASLCSTSRGQMPSAIPSDKTLATRSPRALVIGNDLYPQAPLANAVNDALAMKTALADAQFAVTLVTNATLAQVEQSVGDFLGHIQQGDVAIVYYAGHGFQIDGENYIVPVDFSATDAATAKLRAVPMSSITEGFIQHKVHTGILMADACRDNPFATSRSLLPGLAAMSGGAGILIGLATSPGKTASDNPTHGHGLYTQALLDNLKRPGLTVEQIFNAVTHQVSSESHGAQVPWTGSALRDSASLIAPPAVRPNDARRSQSRDAPVLRDPVSFETAGSAGNSELGQHAVVRSAGLDPTYHSFVAGAQSANSTAAQTVLTPTAVLKKVQPTFLGQPNTLASNNRALIAAGNQELFSAIAEDVRRGDAQHAQTALDNLGPGPLDYRVALYTGEIALIQGKYQTASDAFATSIQQAPLNPLPVYLRALTSALLGQYSAAMSDIASGISNTPDEPYWLLAKANVLYVTGSYADAIALCNQVIAHHPSASAVAYVIRGNCERTLGNTKAANEDYTMAARMQDGQ